jgi:hypothetical protein
MQYHSDTRTVIDAQVDSVLPKFGLAYVSDGEHCWGVTRQDLGIAFESLAPGMRVRLELQQHGGTSLVHRCQPVG